MSQFEGGYGNNGKGELTPESEGVYEIQAEDFKPGKVMTATTYLERKWPETNYEFNEDGVIDDLDLAILAGSLGDECPGG